jgi:hypothetical protein
MTLAAFSGAAFAASFAGVLVTALAVVLATGFALAAIFFGALVLAAVVAVPLFFVVAGFVLVAMENLLLLKLTVYIV